MNCLTDYIGIKACSTDISGSGQFINSLPGVSLESVEKIAEPEQITYKGVWADVQEEAWSRFYVDVINELTKCYQLQPYCDYENLICENKSRLITAWKYLLGNQLMQFRLYTVRLNRFTTVDLKQAAELRDFYAVEYENALSLAAKIMDVSACDCMDCSGNPETVTWLP